MMKKVKILGVFLCIVFLPLITYFAWYLIYSATSVICLESKPEDTFAFGKALAINDNYIAVGDPKANRVAIYSYDEANNNWSRTREIYPPKNSVIDRVGYGFGNSLVLNENQLIIGAYSQPKLETIGNEPATEESKLAKEYHGAVYSLLLEPKERSFLQEIALPDSFKLTGYSLTIFNNKIALGATDGTEPYTKPGKVLIVNPSTLQIEKIIKPPSSEQKFVDFGFVIDGNDDYLLVGSQGLTQNGGALLIDKVGKTEEILVIPDPKRPTTRAGSSVALKNNLMALSTSSEKTWMLKLDTEGWSQVDLIRFGSFLNATESYVLISSNERSGMPVETKHIVHLLVKFDEDKTKIKSEIRWKWGIDFKHEGKGIIHNNRLLLSHKGKVVLVSMKNLPSSYVINRSFCKEK